MRVSDFDEGLGFLFVCEGSGFVRWLRVSLRFDGSGLRLGGDACMYVRMFSCIHGIHTYRYR